VAVAIKRPERERPPATEHFDVLILGAGLSGIGAACHLRRAFPGKALAILEAREAIGGTWDLFRYPGIRSDSDMFTMGYSFRPWEDARGIADGPSILNYIRDTAKAHGIEELIRFGHRAVSAAWSSEDARWTVLAERADGEQVTVSCDFLYACTGYYRYDEGYSPPFTGSEDFRGTIIHPQHWPEDLDCAGKRIVVIGSGATAVTLVPSLVGEGASHVTMVQRSPTYIVPIPALDALAARLQRVLPAGLAYSILRWRNVLRMMVIFQLCRRAPGLMRRFFTRLAAAELPDDYDVDTHFTPTYNPWDQRMCLVPSGDLFAAISDGRVSVVTDRIERFTSGGITLASGDELEADLIVTATGLNLLALGGIRLEVDGREIDLRDTMGYKGMMLSGVPNFAMAFGYTNASWTLKCDLTCEYVCRLLNHMDEHGYGYCVARNRDPSITAEPFIDFSSGYILRSIDQFPKQGSKAPWRLYQNYALDILSLRFRPLHDGVLQFASAASSPAGAVPADVVG
jgi:monooxygenase